LKQARNIADDNQFGGLRVKVRSGSDIERVDLTLRLPVTTVVSNANSLSNSASHTDPSCLTLGQYSFTNFERL